MGEKKCKWCEKPVIGAMKYCDKSCRRKARVKRKKEEIESNMSRGNPVVARETKMESVFCDCPAFVGDKGNTRCTACGKTPNITTRKKLDESAHKN